MQQKVLLLKNEHYDVKGDGLSIRLSTSCAEDRRNITGNIPWIR